MRSYFCNRLWFRLPRNCCKSIPSWFVHTLAYRQVKQEFLPTVLVCGPPKYSELRIDSAQAFNTIGAVIGPVLGSYVFEKTSDSVNSLKNVQWVHLAGVFFISNIYGVIDADMERQQDSLTLERKKSRSRNTIPYFTLNLFSLAIAVLKVSTSLLEHEIIISLK